MKLKDLITYPTAILAGLSHGAINASQTHKFIAGVPFMLLKTKDVPIIYKLPFILIFSLNFIGLEVLENKKFMAKAKSQTTSFLQQIKTSLKQYKIANGASVIGALCDGTIAFVHINETIGHINHITTPGIILGTIGGTSAAIQFFAVEGSELKELLMTEEGEFKNIFEIDKLYLQQNNYHWRKKLRVVSANIVAMLGSFGFSCLALRDLHTLFTLLGASSKFALGLSTPLAGIYFFADLLLYGAGLKMAIYNEQEEDITRITLNNFKIIAKRHPGPLFVASLGALLIGIVVYVGADGAYDLVSLNEPTIAAKLIFAVLGIIRAFASFITEGTRFVNWRLGKLEKRIYTDNDEEEGTVPLMNSDGSEGKQSDKVLLSLNRPWERSYYSLDQLMLDLFTASAIFLLKVSLEQTIAPKYSPYELFYSYFMDAGLINLLFHATERNFSKSDKVTNVDYDESSILSFIQLVLAYLSSEQVEGFTVKKLKNGEIHHIENTENKNNTLLFPHPIAQPIYIAGDFEKLLESAKTKKKDGKKKNVGEKEEISEVYQQTKELLSHFQSVLFPQHFFEEADWNKYSDIIWPVNTIESGWVIIHIKSGKQNPSSTPKLTITEYNGQGYGDSSHYTKAVKYLLQKNASALEIISNELLDKRLFSTEEDTSKNILAMHDLFQLITQGKVTLPNDGIYKPGLVELRSLHLDLALWVEKNARDAETRKIASEFKKTNLQKLNSEKTIVYKEGPWKNRKITEGLVWLGMVAVPTAAGCLAQYFAHWVYADAEHKEEEKVQSLAEYWGAGAAAISGVFFKRLSIRYCMNWQSNHGSEENIPGMKFF